MQESEIGEYIRTQTLPSAAMVKKAKILVIKALRSNVVNEGDYLSTEKILVSVVDALQRDRDVAQSPLHDPEGFEYIHPSLKQIQLEIATREALQLLHASGELIVNGSFDRGMIRSAITLHGKLRTLTVDGPLKPSVHGQYKLSTLFQGNQEYLE